jgi:AcrR family transcriptional regulator
MPRQRGAAGQRADARRNRARILDVAFTAFAREGLGVSIQEIARRAGVSTGTVSRHFPTKDDLFTAIVLDRAERLVATARALAERELPGAAFYQFIEVMALEGAQNRGMGDALAGAGFDVKAAAAGADQDLLGTWNALLTRAQAAGDVRAEGADHRLLLDQGRPGPQPGRRAPHAVGHHSRTPAHNNHVASWPAATTCAASRGVRVRSHHVCGVG